MRRFLADGTVAAALPAQPHPVIRMLERLPGLSNIVQAGTGIYSGSEPFGEEGFSSLARMGIRTVISVDGAKPNGDEAHRHGMQYIHIPIGYDGVHERARLAFVRVAREVDRPIYVHCHHGQHRGPAATAIVCIAADGLDAGDALSILKTAGTGKEYAGLWRDVANFSLPATDAAIPELHEVAQVKSLTAAMAGLDRHWDNLKLCRDAGWETPRDHPDLSPAREALLLREALHEARRTAPTDTLDDRFREWLQAAEVLAVRIEEELKEGKPDDASRRIQILEQSCKTCHAKYRN